MKVFNRVLKTYSKVYDFRTGFQPSTNRCRKAIQNPSGFEQLSYSEFDDDDGMKK
jgi:hypothetical protein